jgi:hypothetical protein
MSEPAVEIAMRIPGLWSHPKELLDRLPEGHRLTPESLFLPDGTEIGFGAMKSDDQFAQIFRSSCRHPASPEELAIVDNYKVNALLMGPGGSKAAAHTMMRAAAALIQAGGAGGFIDNCALAHGAGQWLSMTDDGGPDAISFAFVGIVSSRTEVWTMGMHALGLRDIIMKRKDADEFDPVDVIRYMARGDKPVGDGHIFADLSGPRFQAFGEKSAEEREGSPLYNPFGRLKLVSVKEITESN